jgi:hypothetical protein
VVDGNGEKFHCCLDCGKRLQLGDKCMTAGEDRWWHEECFNANLTPFHQRPRSYDLRKSTVSK